ASVEAASSRLNIIFPSDAAGCRGYIGMNQLSLDNLVLLFPGKANVEAASSRLNIIFPSDATGCRSYLRMKQLFLDKLVLLLI
ncbi:hypothetical protein ACFL27_22785, partial [candidate division CSSED10-310 bacterium]